ncbi:MAG: hypothetical protein ACYTGB_05590 [Planctomycetota bacterium]|jgi:hypothetical protein
MKTISSVLMTAAFGAAVACAGEKAAEGARFTNADILVVAKLAEAQAGPVARSLPPVYTYQLKLVVKEVLRGELEAGKEITAGYSARQMDPPKLPVGKPCIATLSSARGRLRVEFIAEAEDALLKAAKAAASLPAGWKLEAGKPVSPWAALGEKAWPAGLELKGSGVKCATTGRPALIVGGAAKVTVEPVPPARKLKWGNPDGDGEYRITVSNPTEKAITVPALLAVDGKPLWNECVVIICQGLARPAPGARGVPAGAKPLVLEPGKSASGVINALAMKNVDWPRGGYGIEFQFCLGEKSFKKSFYYLSKHHDKIREGQ